MTRWQRIALTLTAVGLPAALAAAGGSLSGAFEVNNLLPAGAELTATASFEDGDAPVASTAVAAADGEVAFAFAGLAPGAYRVELVAAVGEGSLVLSTLTGIELSEAETSVTGLTGDAIGVDGSASGTITLAGEPPPDRLLLVRADRTDVRLASPMPDALNRLSLEPDREEIAAGSFAYAFEGMSYGVYKIELIGYDYRTHTVESYGAFGEAVTLDARGPSREGLDFTVELTTD